jgi:C1q domain
MKTKLLLSIFFFISTNFLFAQIIKSDIVLGTNEEGTAIRGIAKKTVPIDPTYGIFGYNLATNSNGIGVGGYTVGTGYGIYGFSQSGKAGFFTSNTGFALVTGAGYVGINLDPSARLHVGGNETEKLRLENTTALNTGINTEMYFKTGTFFSGAIKTIGVSSQSARMGFFTFAGTNPQDLVERMTILDGGNVGIGSTSPPEKLTVGGNIRSTSLAGTGNRPVFANSSGTLIAQNRIAFSATPSHELLFPYNTPTIAICNSELFDISNNYNNATGEFTAPVDGIYHFVCNLQLGDNPNPRFELGFYKNNIKIRETNEKYNSISPSMYISLTTILQLSANDVITVKGTNQQSSITARSGFGEVFTNFSGYLIY